jgi:hypothetical protein
VKLKHPPSAWLRIAINAMIDNFQDALSILVAIGNAMTLVGLAIKSPFLMTDGAFVTTIFVVWLFVERRRQKKP